MPDRHIRNRIARRLSVFGPAAIVILIGVLGYSALGRVRESRAAVQHTRQVLDASNAVQASLTDLESATRGYILTHDSTLLAPTRSAPDELNEALRALRSLTVDNPRQQHRIDTLERIAAQRVFTLDSAVSIEREGRTDFAGIRTRRNAGPVLSGEIRRLVRDIRAEEDSLLVARQARERRATESTAAVIIFGALTAALLAFFVNRNFDTALLERRVALADLRATNDRLQETAVELEFQAEAAQNAAAEAELASEHATEARIAAEESERRAERLQAATEVLTTAIEPAEVASLIVDQAVHALGASSGALATFDPTTREICFRAVRGISVVSVGATISIDGPYPICAAIREGRPVILESEREDQRLFPEAHVQHRLDGVRAVAAFPLMLHDTVTGALIVRFEQERSFDLADQALMIAMTRIAAETFERARLFEAERQARFAAEGANRAKAAFLASMSHELRTPLQAALGFAQLVRSGVYGGVNEEQSEVLGRVERSQMHLARLIDDILDFARLEAGRVRIEAKPVQVADVFADLGPLVEAQASKKRVELALLPPSAELTVLADRQRLQQILVNLVGNAIKFTPENGLIRVGAQRDGTTAAVFIRDTGMGIPSDRLQAIFDPFVQVEDSLTRTATGAGLGLAISRDLARAMGGDLKVESTLGNGSTFTVVLPLAT